MRTDNDYEIDESNDTGEEHAKLVMSRLQVNSDMTLDEIIKQTVPKEMVRMLTNCVDELITETYIKA